MGTFSARPAGLLFVSQPLWGANVRGTMGVDSSVDDNEVAVYRGAGHGVFAGVLAAVVTHWVFGLNLIVMAFIYRFSMAALRWARVGRSQHDKKRPG